MCERKRAHYVVNVLIKKEDALGCQTAESVVGMLKTEAEDCIIDVREDLSRSEDYHLKWLC